MNGIAIGIDAAADALIASLRSKGVEVNLPWDESGNRTWLSDHHSLVHVSGETFDLDTLDGLSEELLTSGLSVSWDDVLSILLKKFGHKPYRALHKPVGAFPVPQEGIADAYQYL